jgi:phospholipid/cholesterol/gamma-HCH transport system substrate-binding protein
MSQPSVQRTELLVGAFLFCGLVLLGGLILKFGDFKYWFRDKTPMTVVFGDAGNLVSRAPIRRGGVEIGRVVEDPSLPPGQTGKVRVPVVIYTEYHVDKQSSFQIKTDGLIGDTFIEVTPPKDPSQSWYEKGDEIAGTSGAGFNDLSNAANRVAEETLLVLRDIRESFGDLKTKISEGILSSKNIENFNVAMEDLKGSLDKIDNKVLSDTNIDKLGSGVAKLSESADKLSTGIDGITKTFQSADDAINKSFSPALADFGEAAKSFRKMGEQFGLVATDVRSAPGLVSGLLKDSKIRKEFTEFVSNLKRHGIWRYKDDAAELEAKELQEKQRQQQQQQQPQPQPKRGFRLFGGS